MTTACQSCGHESPASNRFCEECGATLERRCGSCGGDVPPTAKFCGACGASLAASPESRVDGHGRRPDGVEARKVLTVVFADLIGSTALHERLDAESVRSLMGRYYAALHAVVETHGGTVVKLLGDGVMAAFGLPRVAEDDAIRAVRAAFAMQQAFRALAHEQSAAVGKIGLRVAVNTGEVVVEAATDDVIGDPVNVAARLQDVAQDGDVVIGEATRRLVGALVTLAPLGPVALRGRAETVAAYRVVSLEPPGGAAAVAFVGREEELRRLAAVYDGAVAAPAARLAVVLGSPGVGKSRLLDEFTGRLGGTTVLVAHCEAAGGATFAPIAKALRTVLGVGAGTGGYDLRAAIDTVVPGNDAERGRIAAGIAALLGGTPAALEETFFVVRRLLTGLATAQPVVLVIDDAQWAEPLLLDMIEHLVQWSTGVPLVLLVAARPDLREARSALATAGRLVSDIVMLGGLDAAAATRLAAGVIGAEALPAAVAGRVLATSEGNPLFLGELVRMLVDDGALRREGDRWTATVDLAAVDMPPTIHALLAARIERLSAADRLVLERAAIVGRQFSRAAVSHLLPSDAADLDARLETLRRSELIEPDVAWFLGEPALRFHHGLVRDAAYRRVLKGTRAELHGRLADWIESRVEGAVEHDETIGWHLEQAHRHLAELGPVDADGRAVGERAARYLAAAGRRALERDDLPLAASLLGRALERLDEADVARADLALDWCEALLAAGDVGPAARAVGELERFATGSDRLRAWHTCFAGQLAVLTDPRTLRITADAVAAAAEELAAVGDEAGEAKAHSVHALALARLGKVGACEAALDKALAAARRANDRRRSNAVLGGAPLAALWGPSPVTRASGRCLDVVRVLRITEGAPAVEAVALRCQAVLEALRGRTEAARRMIASSRHMIEELGLMQQLLEADVFSGLIDLLEGDAAAAERDLRGAYEGLRSHGLGIDAARAAAFLGRALLEQGRAAEAEALSHESEALAGDDLEAAITWRGVRAEALAERGEHAGAVEIARTAVDIAAATDALLHHADSRLALAAALRAAGRAEEAAAEEAHAVELWEAKGATVPLERVRRGIGGPRPVDRPTIEGAEPIVRRRVRPNAATANAASLAAVIAARDADAIVSHFADDLEVVDHANGTTYDRQGSLHTWHGLLKARAGTCRIEPLATLGDSLALYRQWFSAAGTASQHFDVGPYEVENVLVSEVDAEGRDRCREVFAADRLGDAVVRLYERYAGLLPEGAARARAAATARSVSNLVASYDVDRWAAAIAPDITAVDRRTLGLGSARGANAVLRAVRSLLEASDDPTASIDDVLDLRSDALLLRVTSVGTDRVSGGRYERPFLVILVFGADGLMTRHEQFDADSDAEALARFDELSGESSVAPPVQRRVLPNVATTHAATVDAAVAAGDLDTLAALIANEYELVDHLTGVTYDREGELFGLRALLSAENPTCRQEPLATLGDVLVLYRLSMSASRFVGGTLDVGAYEREHVGLIEVDTLGRRRWSETFAPDHLGQAVTRLYERYAETFPDGPARDRAAATARSVAALLGPLEVDRWAAAIAPDVECLDHRTLGLPPLHGAEAFLGGLRSLLDLVENTVARVDDVLGLCPGALLVRWANLGTLRTGGGTYERDVIALRLFGADGLLTRYELFDPEHADAALARFDELTDARSPTVPPRFEKQRTRRVRANAATANAARIDAAIAARDVEAFSTLLAEDSEVLEHVTGATYGREGTLRTWRSLLRADGLSSGHEPLATLGDSLALFRHSMSARGVAGGTVDVGAYEAERVVLNEVDAQGRRRRAEMFAVDRLGDAVVRLYERHAELLPDGPERSRIATIARAVAAQVGPLDLGRFVSAVAPAVEYVDHRRMISFGSLHGAQAFGAALGTLFEAADGVTNRVDDVLALGPDVLVLRVTNHGVDRIGGGVYERPFVALSGFGPDGLAARVEQFDVGHEAEALARFDELAARPAPGASRVPARPVHRVRANAATANADRLTAAVAARDEVFPALFADGYEHVDHITGVTYDRQGEIASYHTLVRARDPTWRHDPLATLGDSLALARVSSSASGFAGRTFDVGAYEREYLILLDVDSRGRARWTESFPTGRLRDAVVRLYERHAELLPDGSERDRAATTARAIAANGTFDPDRWAASITPDVETIDHRILGTWAARGADAYLQHVRSVREVADDAVVRYEDVLALHADALLARATHLGTDRASGGAYERQYLLLNVFGPDGLTTRVEMFDPDRDLEALARFDELTGGARTGLRTHRATAPDRAERMPSVRRRMPANAATAHAARVDAAIAARDAEALPGLFAADLEVVDHMTGVRFGRQGALDTWRVLLKADDPILRQEMLATLGDSLGLCRVSTSASGFVGRTFDVGSYEQVEIAVIEVDAQRRARRRERFAADRLGEAVVRLYERHAELLPDGPEHDRAAATARSIAAPLGPLDLDHLLASLAPAVEFLDHRLLGFGSMHGAQPFGDLLRTLFESTEHVADRVDDVLALRSDAVLLRVRNSGTQRAGGGAFERHLLRLWVFGPDGLATRIEQFDVGDEAAALARFDELAAAVSAPRFENAATRVWDRIGAAWTGRDWEGVAALFPAGFQHDDRRRLIRLELDRDEWLASYRQLVDMTSGLRGEVLATRGERLAMMRAQWEGADPSVGPSEIESLLVAEVDDHGNAVAGVEFDPDDLDVAYAELDERYAAGEAAPYATTWEAIRGTQRSIAARDWERLAAAFAPGFVLEDHRPVGLLGSLSSAEYVASARALVELRPDARFRLDHVLALDDGRALFVGGWAGAEPEGVFEIRAVVAAESGANGVRAYHVYGLEQLDAARACYDRLRPDPLRIPPNTATRAVTRVWQCVEAGDWEGARTLYAPTFAMDDRRRLVRLTGDREMAIANLQFLARSGARPSHTVLATAGDRLALGHLPWAGRDEAPAESSGGGRDGRWPPFEVEMFQILEVDAEGRMIAGILFDPDDRRAANAEMLERHARSDEARCIPEAMFEAIRAINDHDLDRLRAALHDRFVYDDHRRTGIGRLEGIDDYVASLRPLFEGAPDFSTDILCYVAAEKHGSLQIARTFGTLAEGGEFESVFVRLMLYRDGRIGAVEQFELEHLDAARARFEALRPSTPTSVSADHDAGVSTRELRR